MATEKRLIDANALIDEIDGIYQRHYINSSYKFIHDFFRAVFRRIHKSPTVDAVEVVRCEKCRYCDPERHYCDHPMSTSIPIPRKPDDFCSYGGRRDNERKAD